MRFLTPVYIGFLIACACACAHARPSASAWSGVTQALQQGIDTYAYPGAVGLVADSTGVLYWEAVGNFTYGIPPPLNDGKNPAMNTHSLFDLASCTKVVSTTTAVAQFYERGELDLDTPVQDILGPQFGANGKETITVRNCLLHNAGFPADPIPNYWDPSFGCPQTSQPQPAEDFSCQTQIYNSLMAQTLQNPVGEVYVYSDLSFITLMYVVGHLAEELGYVSHADIIPDCDTGGPGIDQCYYEAYMRIHVFEYLQMRHTGFLQKELYWPMSAPCENDTSYQNKVLQGQVSDGNAYAMGGIAGHAGLFSNAADLYQLVSRVMFADQYPDPIMNSTTATYFTTEYNHTQSCRALGWSTNDPDAYDYGWSLSCGNMSSTTWTHIGYTGTQICGDPERQYFTIFLTNRVYPTSANNQMNEYRQLFNNAVLAVMDGNTEADAHEATPNLDLRATARNHVSD